MINDDNNKTIVDMKMLDNEVLLEGCKKVIGTLATYPVEYKIAILHELINTIPVKYEIMEMKK